MIGERGGSTPDFETAQELLRQYKADWSLTIKAAIEATLAGTGYFHAEDLLELGVPADCKNCVGAQIQAQLRSGAMRETGVRRATKDPAGHGRRSAVYEITEAGRQRLRPPADEELEQDVEPSVEQGSLFDAGTPPSIGHLDLDQREP